MTEQSMVAAAFRPDCQSAVSGGTLPSLAPESWCQTVLVLLLSMSGGKPGVAAAVAETQGWELSLRRFSTW
jgi:hypothetical protein